DAAMNLSAMRNPQFCPWMLMQPIELRQCVDITGSVRRLRRRCRRGHVRRTAKVEKETEVWLRRVAFGKLTQSKTLFNKGKDRCRIDRSVINIVSFGERRHNHIRDSEAGKDKITSRPGFGGANIARAENRSYPVR